MQNPLRHTRRWVLPVLVALFAALGVRAQDTLYASASGERLRSYYRSLDVEHLWLRGYPVDWETGQPRTAGVYYEKGHSHCSAFAAAACKRLGIYILRPPAHAAKLLANAQFDWLAGDEGRKAGWRPIPDASVADAFLEAQRDADNGEVVVAVCRNPDPAKPGHIALVLPATVPAADVVRNGPMVVQAGKENYDSTSMLVGFKSHIHGAYHNEVKFYRNIGKPDCGGVAPAQQSSQPENR